MRMCLAVTTVLALSAVCFAEPPDPIEQLKTEPSQLRLFILKQDQQIDALKKELDRTKERLQALDRPYSAIFFQFYVPGKPKKVLIARAEWAPFGDWDLADKAPPGVYKNHELTIRLHK